MLLLVDPDKSPTRGLRSDIDPDSPLSRGQRKMRAGLLAWVAILILASAVSRAQAQNAPIEYFYDDVGRLTKVVDPSGNVATYRYDAVGNLLSITRSTVPANNGLAVLSFTPQQGTIGQTVTIQGQGFSTAPSSNAVQFNGVSATVTAASATTLTAIVPPGATTGPISATVSGNAG